MTVTVTVHTTVTALPQQGQLLPVQPLLPLVSDQYLSWRESQHLQACFNTPSSTDCVGTELIMVGLSVPRRLPAVCMCVCVRLWHMSVHVCRAHDNKWQHVGVKAAGCGRVHQVSMSVHVCSGQDVRGTRWGHGADPAAEEEQAVGQQGR